jgi:hypothetical protein
LLQIQPCYFARSRRFKIPEKGSENLQTSLNKQENGLLFQNAMRAFLPLREAKLQDIHFFKTP